ncbi:protein NipSnap-like isoform X2 [Homarus americanus]|uniref:protein NipSnap-like isoform X2 n=1 Tax=Homarus americanus TaxID=6706 RepID=UPI001C452CAC|nr:protein NipSnap-like isoform X2 [Homarus americanus]
MTTRGQRQCGSDVILIMATRAMLLKRAAVFSPSIQHFLHVRCVSTTGCTSQKDSWLNKLLVRKIEPTKESHSRMLSDKEVIFELQTHNLKPGTGEQYLKNYEEYVKGVTDKFADKAYHPELQGSWTVGVGDQDQCLHLWKYAGGYGAIDAANDMYATDPDLSKLIQDRNPFLRQRSNQFLLPFSFWPPVSPREGGNIYEIRSYFLKPGTMIEWGNNWSRAIHFRQANNEAFGGFFSQVGRLYNVHHIWCYSSLEARKEARENAWRHPGWDEVVAYTVPLIREMHARILVPNSISPAQ